MVGMIQLRLPTLPCAGELGSRIAIGSSTDKMDYCSSTSNFSLEKGEKAS